MRTDLFNCSESTITGGFVAAGGDNTTVIKAEGVYHLLAHGIQSEPGARSRGFDFDSRCLANMVISGDNDAGAGTSLDPGFMQMGSGIHIGDFSNLSETWLAEGIAYQMPFQVEGKAYIRELAAANVSCVAPSRSSACRRQSAEVHEAMAAPINI